MNWQEIGSRLIERWIPLGAGMSITAVALAVVMGLLLGWLGRRLAANRREREALRRVGREHGLSRSQRRILARLARAGHAAPAAAVSESARAFDLCVTRAARHGLHLTAPAIIGLRRKLGFADERTRCCLTSTVQIERNQVVQVRVGEAGFQAWVLEILDQGIRLSLPERPDQVLWLGPKRRASVGFDVPDDAQYGFDSMVLSVHEDSFIIEHSFNLGREQRRRHVRVRCSMGTECRVEGATGRALADDAVITDVSVGGVCLTVSGRVSEQSRVVFNLAHPQYDGGIAVEGRVLRTTPLIEGKESLFRLHVQLKLTRRQEAVLGRVVSALQRAAIRRRTWIEAATAGAVGEGPSSVSSAPA